MKANLCPFCGKAPGRTLYYGGESKTVSSSADETVALVCKNCGADGPVVATTLRTRDKRNTELAFKAWNKRVPLVTGRGCESEASMKRRARRKKP